MSEAHFSFMPVVDSDALIPFCSVTLQNELPIPSFRGAFARRRRGDGSAGHSTKQSFQGISFREESLRPVLFGLSGRLGVVLPPFGTE